MVDYSPSPRYTLIFRGEGVPAEADQLQSFMEEWNTWFSRLGSALLDGGAPFGSSKSVAPDGTITDNAPSALTGYVVIQAHNLEDAAKLSTDCPIRQAGGTIDVYEGLYVL